MKRMKVTRFQNSHRFGDYHRQDALTDDEFFDWQVVLEGMTKLQLQKFNEAPENKALLIQYRAYLRRRLMPYVAALSFAFALSVAAGILIAW